MMGTKGGILGVGNVLQQDDGIGVTVLKYLEANYIFPENVELIDGGTTGAGLDTSIVDKEWLIVIDALAVSGDPGEVKLLREEEFINKPSSIRMTPHQVGFLDLIQILRIDDSGPKDVDLIGIIPKDLDFLPTLSPEVKASMDKVVAVLLKWLKDKGIVPVKQTAPKPPDYWWLPIE
ncbi:MAG: HyaD/HybD family hydrogenase maturation endopeptidase [Deltaproteobacteria bacterium]|jgi:hydrogenase maturation protease|nr:HyaD/HybD family hydrogenase maturation endopeptidase [Deltaproteobacteria bacterium]